MDISKIDKNLKVETEIKRDNLIWLDASQSPFKVYGAYSCNPYSRLKKEVADKTNDGVAGLNFHTAGIRVRFRTNSPFIAIKAFFPRLTRFPHMPITGTSGFDLYKYSDGVQHYIKTFTPPVDANNGYESIVDLPNTMSDFVLNFPLYNKVDRLLIGVSSDCLFEEPASYINEKPVVFYGSSITQGGCASRPGNCYQNLLSQKLNFDYVNLGFSGSGRAEDIITEYMAEMDMSIFVSDYDHNAPNIEHLKNTHYKMYETIRKKHPDIPYIMLSMPNIDIAPYIPAKKAETNRRSVIMESYVKALQNGDENVYFVDGASLFSDNFDSSTVDGCHPNDLGFYFFSKMLYPVIKKLLYK